MKKTKGVIISTIVLHVLLASLYFSWHGSLVQTSNNQAGPLGEKFQNDLHLKCACADVFVLVRGKCCKGQTGSLRILLLQPQHYHPSTTYRGKILRVVI